MSWATWLLFLSVSLAAAFSPGPGVLMAISTAGTQGARRAAYSSAGNALGVFMVACTAVTGLGLLLRTSALAFGALKIAGAAYLIHIGVKSWRQGAVQPRQADPSATAAGAGAAPAPAPQAGRLRTFRSGLLVAVSNPKSILFFTAVFPQFMPHDHPDPLRFLLLTATFTACTLLSHAFYVLCAGWLRRGVRSAVHARLARRLGGTLFIVMGGALLAASGR